jgi:UDP-2,4-diacetamido-2,4,6-trideoxy-beta-L-altropyranose hydrolase
MNIAFRVDSSIQIGIGHVIRCLSLADQIKNKANNIFFVTQSMNGSLEQLISEKGYKVILLPWNDEIINHENNSLQSNEYNEIDWLQDSNATKEAIEDKKIDWLIVDHYGIDYRWHKIIAKFTNKIMVIDDLANRKLHCNVLLDQTYGRKFEDYDQLIGVETEMLLGANYALLRPEFSNLRIPAVNKRKKIESISNVLISIGGMDYKNITQKVLDVFLKVEWKNIIEVNIVLNNHAPNRKSIQSFLKKTKSHHKFNLLINPDNIAELMFEADLAVGSSGTSTWERCTMALPTIAICVADNQKFISKKLHKDGVHIALTLDDHEEIPCLFTELCRFNDHPDNLKDLSNESIKVCQAKGSILVALKIFPHYTNDGGKIDLRKVEISDSKLIYGWQKNPKTREYANDSSIPSWDNHIEWMSQKINSPLSYFWLVLHNGIPSGVLRLDPINLGEGDGYLISIFIDPKKHGLGIGKKAIDIAKYIFLGTTLYAKVLENNKRSISLFYGSNFKFREDLTYFELR